MQTRGTNNQNKIFEAGLTYKEMVTLGWEPTCSCGIQETVPAIVFDPFSGSGTTVMVARNLGRSGIGLDLSFKYIQECARERLGMDDLQAWMEGKKVKSSDVSDLPMFAGLSV